MSTNSQVVVPGINPTSRTLDIDGMLGATCIDKVSGVLKGVRGVSTESVKVGSAVIGSDQAGCDAACAAIDRAGFKSREHSETNGSNARATQDGGETQSSTHRAPQQHQAKAHADSKSPAADAQPRPDANSGTSGKGSAHKA